MYPEAGIGATILSWKSMDLRIEVAAITRSDSGGWGLPAGKPTTEVGVYPHLLWK